MGSTRRNVVAFVVGCVVIAASGGFAAINATTASADPPTPFTQCPAVGAATSCNILIVLDDSGAHIYTDHAVSPFDLGETNPNGEDTLIGVENDSSTPVASLPLASSTVDIFGFDADGLCAFVTCSWPNPTTYEGPNTSFSAISGDKKSGTVNFTTPLAANGGTTYFSLEGALETASFQPPVPPHVPGAPTIGTVLPGNGALAVSFTDGGQGSSPTLGYQATCTSPNGSAGSSVDSGSPIVVPGLTNGATYTCSVLAWNKVGNSPPSGNSAPATPTPTAKRMDDCTDTTTCQATIPQSSSKLAPGQSAGVVGTPSDPTGTVVLTGTLGTLDCDSINGSKPGPITELFDEGFSPSTRLTITMTLKIASSTTPGQICYESEIPFFSQGSPTVKQAGTGYLLLCSQINNIAPCVISTKQVGSNIVVKFVVPGGDPRFCVLLPKGRLTWLAGAATAKLNVAFNAQLQSTGGRAPVHWKISSGKLPAGLLLGGSTGSISGKPKVRGLQTAVVAGTDSASPPQTAKLSVPIKVT